MHFYALTLIIMSSAGSFRTGRCGLTLAVGTPLILDILFQELNWFCKIYQQNIPYSELCFFHEVCIVKHFLYVKSLIDLYLL